MNISTVTSSNETPNGRFDDGKISRLAGADKPLSAGRGHIRIGRSRAQLLRDGMRLVCGTVVGLATLVGDSAVAQPRDAPRVEEKKPDARSRVEERKTDTVISVDGRRMSKDEFLVEFARKKKAAEAARKKAGTAKSFMERLAQENAKRIAANNAKVAARKPPSQKPPSIKPGVAVAPCLKPKIEGVFYVPPAEPGSGILVWGCGFGDSGELRLRLAEGNKTLETPVWGKGGIQAMIPGGLSGVLDQKAKLQVTVGNAVSNFWPIEFRAARQTKVLTWSDVANIACATEGSGDKGGCNLQVYKHLSDVTTAVGDHRYSSLGMGFDKIFSKPLKNGWTVESAHVTWQYAYYTQPSNQQVALVLGFQPGGSSAVGTVNWWYVGSGGIHYTLDVVVEGIRGTSYK